MAKEKKDKWTQYGNFLVGVEKNSTGDFLVCKSVASDWSVRWRDDTMMFGMMLSLTRNANAKDYMHSLITLMYVASTYPHDLVSLINRDSMPFMEGFAKLIEEQNSYEITLAPKTTDDEEAEALVDVRMTAELEKELSEDKDNG